MNLLPVIHDALGLCLKDKTTLSDASTKSIRKFSLSLSTANTKSIGHKKVLRFHIPFLQQLFSKSLSSGMVCTPSSYQGRRSQLRGKATNVPGSIGFSPLSNISPLSLLNRFLCFCKWRWCDLNTKRFIFKPSLQANTFQDLVTVNWDEQNPNPNQLRWKPFSLPQSGEKV